MVYTTSLGSRPAAPKDVNPRKGTETKKWERGKLVDGHRSERRESPEGDGNRPSHPGPRSRRCTPKDVNPRKGTETRGKVVVTDVDASFLRKT